MFKKKNHKIMCKQLPAITAEFELVGETVVATEGKKTEPLRTVTRPFDNNRILSI